MKRSRLTDRLLVLCAVALVGSVALMPMRSLASDSRTRSSAPKQLSVHHDRNGAGDDDRGADAVTRAADAIRPGDERPSPTHQAGSADHLDCSSPRANHGRDACGGTSSAAVQTAPDELQPSSRTRTALQGGGTTEGAASQTGSATTTSVSQPPAGTGVVPSSHGAPPVQGVTLPGTSVAIGPPASPPASGRPAPLPNASSAARSIVNALLGPVPVLVPGVADTLSRAGGVLPWGWFIAFAVVDVLLAVVIIVRRRRSASGAA
jgi:hypothetical protein